MIRKLLLPAVAALLLGGCMTGGYNYRNGPGDYYYGQPSVDYRYYGSPYRHYYGYPYYRRGYYGYGRYGYYGYPYYYHRTRPPLVIRPRPDYDNDDDNSVDIPARPAQPDNDRGAPWRNLDDLRRRKQPPHPVVRRVQPQSRPVPQSRPAPQPSSRSRGDSRLERMVRRARRSGESDERHPPR